MQISELNFNFISNPRTKLTSLFLYRTLEAMPARKTSSCCLFISFFYFRWIREKPESFSVSDLWFWLKLSTCYEEHSGDRKGNFNSIFYVTARDHLVRVARKFTSGSISKLRQLFSLLAHNFSRGCSWTVIYLRDWHVWQQDIKLLRAFTGSWKFWGLHPFV